MEREIGRQGSARGQPEVSQGSARGLQHQTTTLCAWLVSVPCCAFLCLTYFLYKINMNEFIIKKRLLIKKSLFTHKCLKRINKCSAAREYNATHHITPSGRRRSWILITELMRFLGSEPESHNSNTNCSQPLVGGRLNTETTTGGLHIAAAACADG